MEGHRTNPERGRKPARGGGDSALAVKKRAFLLLDRERASLKTGLRARWQPLNRYEDLYLVTMLTRLERDWLFQPRQRIRGGDLSISGDPFGREVAEWAKPWQLAPLSKLDADLGGLERALKQHVRWLSPLATLEAERRAGARFEEITSQLHQRDPPPAAAASAAVGHLNEKARAFGGPSRFRISAIAGLLFVTAAIVGVLAASRDDSGRGDSSSRPAGLEGGPQRPAVLNVSPGRHSATGSRGPRRGAHRPSRPAQHPGGRQPPPARQAAESVPVASSPAPLSPQVPPAEPAAVAPSASIPAPAPAAAPAPAPQPPNAAPSGTSANPQAGGGGADCPPEFGYEC